MRRKAKPIKKERKYYAECTACGEYYLIPKQNELTNKCRRCRK